MAMWQPDGWAQTRIGVLTPHADVWPEAEFGAMATDGISIHAARVPFGAYKSDGTMDRTIADDPVRAFADPPLVDDAAELLASAPLHAIAYGFTSSSYVRAAADDAKLKVAPGETHARHPRGHYLRSGGFGICGRRVKRPAPSRPRLGRDGLWPPCSPPG